jgi:hypothetical protein
MTARIHVALKVTIAVLSIAAAPACYQYRQQAQGITPASDCPDFSRGCSTTPLNNRYKGYTVADSTKDMQRPPEERCGPTGLSEVTVRDCPHYFLLTLVTLGFASPMRVEWKCARPNPEEGDLLVPRAAPPSPARADTARTGTGTMWSLLWGALTLGAPRAQCGDVGLAYVTISDRPHYFLLTLVLGLASPKRVEWACAAASSQDGASQAAMSADSKGGI